MKLKKNFILFVIIQNYLFQHNNNFNYSSLEDLFTLDVFEGNTQKQVNDASRKLHEKKQS